MKNIDVNRNIDSLFSTWDKPGSPGAVVLITQNGKVVFKKGYGYANLEYNLPLKPNTVFQAASISKQFTAMGIALLKRDGKLSLGDRIEKYLPSFPDLGHKITIRHLIHHVSGLREEIALLSLAGWRMDDVITNEHIIKMINRQKSLNFEPGSDYVYCNSGYTLLAQIIQKVSEQSFPEFIQNRILTPLEMTNSQIVDDHELIIKNVADSYSPTSDGQFKKHTLNWAGFGSTNLYTTVEDLGKWMLNFETGKVGGFEVLTRMHKTYTLTNGKTIDYAFGIKIQDYKGLKLVCHTGSDAGFRNYCARFPDQKLGFAILSNVGSFPRETIAMKIADILLANSTAKIQPTVHIDEEKTSEKQKSKPKSKFVSIHEDVLKEYTGKYYSKELQTSYRLKINDGKLIAQHQRHKDIQLLPTGHDRFHAETGPLSDISFVRDNKKQVIGFNHTGPGIANLAFSKV